MTAGATASTPTGATGGGRRTALRTLPAPALGILGIAIFLLVWELVPRLGLANPDYLPPASSVIGVFVRNLGLASFWAALGQTMLGWAVGLLVAATAATLVGLVVGSSRFLRQVTHSTIEFLRPIPSVALIPLAVLLFGVRLESTLMLVVYATFWQVLIQVLYGVGDVDPVADNTARSYGLGRLARVRYVVWPTTLPYLMTGLRLGAAVALILAITSELVIGNPGLGHEIAQAQSGGATSPMYALVLAAGFLGVAINVVMRRVERRALRWHTSVRGEVLA